MTFRWTGLADRARVAETRMRCYGRAGREFEQFQKRFDDDPRSADGDFLLAEETPAAGGGAQAVGTLTSLSLSMWMRGSAFGCQGIAWVGTVRTHRRQGGGAANPGVASRLMTEAIAKAREREQVLSALMPFRASFYQHFGYGIVETRDVWTVPMAILPAGPTAGMRYATPEDVPAMAALYQRVVQAGQCNIERSEARWRQLAPAALEEGFLAVDPAADGRGLRGYMMFLPQHHDGKDVIDISDGVWAYEDAEALRRQLHFLASQRDQFSSVTMRLPTDLPLNWILREGQIAHRPVNHPVATVAPQTRMQIRVLDHAKLLENLHLPDKAVGKATVSVKESEGHESRFGVDLQGGRITIATSAAAPRFTCDAHTWASIVGGTLRASTAWRLGLADAEHASAAEALDHLASPGAGPMAFSQEYF
ncbi:MAG TPA: GNAT family N-acetyltransferase [Tepidisphaeraceae bacterium]|jgi:predicted acetyltransferase|nr:GNAT family N-acetyltransferase [Tepidisphaeraceae bacterium]